MRFVTWNVRSLYREGSQVSESKELSKYKLDLVRVQKIRWKCSGTKPAGELTFFYGKRNENLELGTGFFVHNRSMSVVKRVEVVSDRISLLV
jgi:hypothetical protein